MVRIIRTRYIMGRITAADVWGYADEGIISDAEAASICGPRPTGKGVTDET